MVKPTSSLCMFGDLGTGAPGMLEPRTEDGS